MINYYQLFEEEKNLSFKKHDEIDINAHDNDAISPFMYTAQQQKILYTSVLLKDIQIEFNIKNREGNILLHYTQNTNHNTHYSPFLNLLLASKDLSSKL